MTVALPRLFIRIFHKEGGIRILLIFGQRLICIVSPILESTGFIFWYNHNAVASSYWVK